MAEYVCELTAIDSETWETTIGVEVVRCRDCELYRPPSSDNGWNDMCAGGEGLHVTPDGFCAWGERRENE